MPMLRACSGWVMHAALFHAAPHRTNPSSGNRVVQHCMLLVSVNMTRAGRVCGAVEVDMRGGGAGGGGDWWP